MATNSKTTAHSDNVLGVIRGTNVTAPASVDIALHKATTLSASVAVGATSVSLPISPIVGTQIVIDCDGAQPETKTVDSVTGSGPYTVNFTGGLSFAHNSGAYVSFDPGEDLSKLNEVSGGAYARKTVSCNTTEWTAPSNHTAGRKIQNANAQSYPTATADWGVVTHGIVYNGSNGWYYGALAVVRKVLTGDQFSIPANGLTLAED